MAGDQAGMVVEMANTVDNYASDRGHGLGADTRQPTFEETHPSGNPEMHPPVRTDGAGKFDRHVAEP